ncbi:hypothetical protein [Phaeacidiphilus oryzae]|uniref:hypothetical protein n=1 Tax=Phaeacidiphilus oryzae TaxID=348818 RepID=UPI00056739AC|nr:hypothetical protein [Phaeacidiphilus oryzae]
MAQDVTITLWCDWCDLLGLEHVAASHSHTLALDGQPRRVDLCERCHLALEPLEELYRERGQRIEESDGRGRRKSAGARRSVDPGSAPGALPPGLAEHRLATEAAPSKPRSNPEVLTRRGGRVRDPDQPSLICPLEHPHSGTGSMRINYAGRSSHADMVHGLHYTQIHWQDPDHILTVPCRMHQRCLDNEISFTSRRGLTNHIATSNLPTLDGADEGDGAERSAGPGDGSEPTGPDADSDPDPGTDSGTEAASEPQPRHDAGSEEDSEEGPEAEGAEAREPDERHERAEEEGSGRQRPAALFSAP